MNNTAVTTDLRVVLNGGSEIMESATIPFRWFFSDKIIEKQPTSLLVIDQSEWEKKSSDTDRLGERRIVPISRGSDFLQFTSPGHHRLAFIALRARSGDREGYSKWKEKILKQYAQNRYRDSIDWQELESGEFYGDLDGHAVAITIVEVDVPKEFFAVRSDNPIAKFIWNWANRWFETLPRDECSYRKRLILAFTAQLPLLVVGHILKYIAALVCSIYLPVSKIVVLWAGYRPHPLFADIGKLWGWKWEPNEIEWDPRRNTTYRQWIGYGDPDYDAKKGYVYMPITGFEVTALLLMVAMVTVLGYAVSRVFATSTLKDSFPAALGVLVFCSVVCGAFFSKNDVISRSRWWNEMCRWQKEKEREKERLAEAKNRKPFLYFEWLRATAHISDAPSRVEINQLPEAFRGKTIQKARITFWAVKRKVCRPFPRG